MIEIKDFVLSFDSQKPLEIKELSIPAEGVQLIYGGNGGGKTSLVRCILGIRKDFQGEILLDGVSIKTLSREKIARKLSYLPQTSDMDVDITIKDFIRQGLYAVKQGFFDEVVNILNISVLLERNFSALSGGEKQLCRIARSMIADVSYSFLDEPDSFLSRKNKARFLDLIERFSERRGIVIISHGEMRENKDWNSLLELEESD